jgi:hypothetical protein
MLTYEKELLGFIFISSTFKVMAKLEQLHAIPNNTISEEMIKQRVTICGMARTVKRIF